MNDKEEHISADTMVIVNETERLHESGAETGSNEVETSRVVAPRAVLRPQADDEPILATKKVKGGGSFHKKVKASRAFLNEAFKRFVGAEIAVALTIGRYMRENFTSKGRGVSLRAAARAITSEGCLLSRSTLLQCVELWDQKELLGEKSLEGLTKTHQVALLMVKKAEEKEQWAEVARKEHLSANQLRRRLKEVLTVVPMRPSELAAWCRTLKIDGGRLLSKIPTWAFDRTDDHFVAESTEEVESVLCEVRTLRDNLGQVEERLQEVATAKKAA